MSIFGFGALPRLPGLLKPRGFRRILIITDPQIKACGILDGVHDLLKGSFAVDVFDGVPGEPHSTDVDEQRGLSQSNYDLLLGVGGGSAMDFAKALSIVITHGGLLKDYVGEGTVPGPVIPIVCIPTTSGTGSQSTQTAVYTVGGVKLGCSSEYIRPIASLVDPELTVGLPPLVTRNSGYDALMHAIESFIARPYDQVSERPILYQGSNPFSRGLAREAFRLIWTSYREAVSDGVNREARTGMSMGSHLAGIAFSHSGLGLVHALASSLGGMIDAPHGVCLAACTKIGLSYNFEATEPGLAELAAIMEGKGLRHQGPVPGERFLSHIEKLIDDLNLPSSPAQLGIKKRDGRTLFDNTLIQTRRILTNPRPLDEQLLFLIEQSLS